MMQRLLILLLPLLALACQPLRAQSNGDFLFSKVGADGSIEVYLTPNSTDMLGWDGAGALVQIPRSTFLTPATAASTYQPLSATLTTLSSTTAAGLALMDDADASAQRATLGLGTLATQSATITDYLLSATAATTYQPISATLTTLSSATAAGLTLMDDADASAQRATLGLGTSALTDTGTASGNVPVIVDFTLQGPASLRLERSTDPEQDALLYYGGAEWNDVDNSGFHHVVALALPTADRSHTLPDASGTLISTGNLSAINAVGTIASGVWNGTDIAVDYLAQGGATDGQILSWNNAGGTWVPVTISSGLTVGTTTTSGASAGDILTSDGSLVQKLTPGTGVSTWLATPTIANLNAAISDDDPAYVGTANTFTDDQTITLTSLGTTGTTGLALINATAAANGAQQNSPRLQLTANGYTTGGGSVAHNWYAWVKPTQYTGTLPIGGGLPDLGYLQIYGDIGGSQNNVRSGYAGYNDLKLDLHGTLWTNAYTGRQLALGGTPAAGVANISVDTSSGIFVSQNHRFGWVTGFNALVNVGDFELLRLAENTLALTDYTAAGTTLAVMLTHTSATNFESGVIDTRTTANTVRIGSAVGSGGGTARDVHLIRGGTVKASLESGGFAIGSGGAAISKVLTATASLDYDLTAVVVEDKTITVTGAAVGDVVILGVPHGGVTATAQFTGWVSSADTVTIRCRTSVVGENPADTTFRATVIQH